MELPKKAIEVATLSVVTARPEDAVSKAAKIMTRGWFRRLPIVDEGEVVGLVTAKDILRAISRAIPEEADPSCLAEALNTPLAEVIRGPPVTVGPYTPVEEVLDMVVASDVGAALVVDEDGRLLGIVTERDLLRALADLEVRETVQEIMTKEVKALSPDELVIKAVKGMVAGGFRRYPVVDRNGKLVGIVTARDLVALAAECAENPSKASEFFEPVSRVMSKKPLTVSPQFGVMAAVRRTTEAGVGALPVVTAGRLIGIVTEMDLLRAIKRYLKS
ncbi:MAG TPA: CBS domain-containing protein [Candidatus Korarchaeota archaeon]|nr:CBS domain-containing protein [Candidatus Korarchaeota archaeon]